MPGLRLRHLRTDYPGLRSAPELHSINQPIKQSRRIYIASYVASESEAPLPFSNELSLSIGFSLVEPDLNATMLNNYHNDKECQYFVT